MIFLKYFWSIHFYYQLMAIPSSVNQDQLIHLEIKKLDQI